MKREVFHYTVPPERIAIRPLENREDAKLMLVDCSKGDIQHMRFKDIVGFFSEKDVLLLNNTKVIPARLYGKKTSGGAVEVLLLKKKEEGIWDTLIRGRVKDKTILIFDKISAVVIGKNADGSWAVNFGASDHILFNMGKMPIPPYMKRLSDARDNFDYQTVYAKKYGSVAAPTAGLHFTENLLQKLKREGVTIAFLTLHIGWASFRILRQNENRVPPEFFDVPQNTAEVINTALKSRNNICSVGTSTTRAIESAFENGRVVPKKELTDLFIKPGYKFNCINMMITNFHLPGSTHLYMVCAFGGTELIEKAYLSALENDYRFYSYGDAMLIIR